jgi:hypothetical protein
MRLRFYPALWCLLAAIFLSPTSSEATSKATAVKAKTSENKDITNNLSTLSLHVNSVITTNNALAILAINELKMRSLRKIPTNLMVFPALIQNKL